MRIMTVAVTVTIGITKCNETSDKKKKIPPSVPDPFISNPPTLVSLISSRADSNTNRIGMSSILSAQRGKEKASEAIKRVNQLIDSTECIINNIVVKLS